MCSIENFSGTQAGREKLRRLAAATPDIRLILLYGSSARGRAHAESDVDLAVELDPYASSGRPDALRRLIALFAHFWPSERIHVALLNEAPPLLKKEALRTGVVMYERTPGDRARFAMRALREYQDSAWLRDFFRAKRVERLKKGTPHGRPGDILAEVGSLKRLLGED